MPLTYDPIASTKLSSSATNIDFQNIPAWWTDLVVVVSVPGTTDTNVGLRINGDTGANYDTIRISGYPPAGGAAVVDRVAGNALIGLVGNYVVGGSEPTNFTINIQQYRSTAMHKTVLWTNEANQSASSTSGGITRGAGRWRSLFPITSFRLQSFGVNFPSGTVATLFGIKAA